MTNSKALVKHEESIVLSPALVTAIERRNLIVQAMRKDVMEKGRDYGAIPGTDKPTLLKPGAEKLCSLFGLCIEKPQIIEKEQDWTGENHGNEPFFYYLFCQRLTRNGETVAAQMGSCNSWEKKYRYRHTERKCPRCGKAAIIRGKEEYGGGWLCYKKKDGCSAKFAEDDSSITEQQVDKVKNPDVADQVNAILKMAQKRALVAATLVATNASEFFTQDVEDMEIIDAEYTVAEVYPPPPRMASSPQPANGNGHPPKQLTGADLESMIRQRAHEWETKERICTAAKFYERLGDWAAKQGTEISKMRDWPATLIPQAIHYLKQLKQAFQAAAPKALLDTIDKLTDQLGWEKAYREEWLANTHLIQPGEIPNEHQAHAIILALQQQLRDRQAAGPESAAANQEFEVPF